MRGRLSTPIIQKINTIIDLFEDRKISQFSTANNIIQGIITTNKRELAKGLKNYDKAIEKYQDATPIGERETVKKATEKAVEARKKGAINTRLRKEIGEDKLSKASGAITRIAKERLLKDRKLYSVKFMLFTTQDYRPKSAFVINGRPYYVILNPSVRTASIKSQKWIEKMLKVKVLRYRDSALFKRMMVTFRSDPTFRRTTEQAMFNYVDAIRIESIDFIDENVEDYDVLTDELTDANNNVSIYHDYIQTEVNPDCLRMKDALAKGHHIENECWINTLKDHYIDTLMRTKRGILAKNLTREKVLEILNQTDEYFKRNGACIWNMNRVFKEFNIKARIYDMDSKLIYSHDPEDFNSNRIITFNGLVKNSHIYTLNHNLKSLKRTEKELNPYKLKIGNNYYINNRAEARTFNMINSVDDLLQLKEKDEYNLILKDNDLDRAVYELKRAGYEPQLTYTAGRTTEIKCKFTHKLGEKKRKTVHYTIATQHLNIDTIDEDIGVSTEEMYNKVSAEMFKFHKMLISENYKSYYSEIDVKVLDECRTNPPHGRFQHLDEEGWCKTKCSIDRRKAYSFEGTRIFQIPVFKEFDVWRPYDEKCDYNKFGNYTLYLVKACQGNLFFNKKFNLVYGKHLKELSKRGVAMKILFYKTPSYIHKVKYKKAIEKLYKSKISDDKNENGKILKTIANITFGLLEKSYKRKTVSRIFDNLREALKHQKNYDGKIYVMDEVALEPVGWKGDGYHDEDDREYKQIGRTTKYYIVNVSGERQLINGFRYIKELMLQNHNFSMFDAYSRLKRANINVYAVKTDAFHIAREDLAKAMKVLKFGAELGDWRLEDKPVTVTADIYKWRHNELPKIPIYNNERLLIEDEWDTEAICKRIIKVKKCMVRAKYAGSGKSYIGKHFQKMGYNTLFVVPQNMLKQEVDCEAVTQNTFFSVPIHKDDGSLPKYDHSGFNVIVFDKIYMSSPYILNKIRQFVIDNPDKIVIGAGDVKQLPCIEPFTNNQNVENYVDNCIDIIFKHNIFLKICKRVGGKDTEEGERNRKKLDEIYNDFWERDMDMQQWIEKHFRYTKDVMLSENNIAYTNIRCQAVANEIRRRLNKKDKYEVGEILICRLYKKDEGGKLNVNIRWKVVNVDGGLITLQDIKTGEKRTFNEDVVDKHFRYAYCSTCHSRQGTTIKTNITIHEWNKDYLVTKEWLWCAVTRCSDFNNVYFFKNDKADEEMFKNLVVNYFKNKVEGYKMQDRKADREVDEENYIDANWCLRHFKGCCGNCGVKFNLDTRAGKMSSNFTAQRVDNALGHSIDNCEAWCCHCNASAH